MERDSRYHQLTNNGSLEFFRGLPAQIANFLVNKFVHIDYEGMTDAPLDTPVEPVTDWVQPQIFGWDSEGRYLEDER